jgi:hypothetical protein
VQFEFHVDILGAISQLIRVLKPWPSMAMVTAYPFVMLTAAHGKLRWGYLLE